MQLTFLLDAAVERKIDGDERDPDRRREFDDGERIAGGPAVPLVDLA